MTGLSMLLCSLHIEWPWQMCLQCLLRLLVIYESSNDRPIDEGVHQYWQLLLGDMSESGHSIWPYDSWNQSPRRMIRLSDAKSVICCIRVKYRNSLFCGGSSQTLDNLVSLDMKDKEIDLSNHKKKYKSHLLTLPCFFLTIQTVVLKWWQLH